MCGREGKCTSRDDLYFRVMRVVKDGFYTLFYPITTSSTIIKTKPMAKPMVLRFEC